MHADITCRTRATEMVTQALQLLRQAAHHAFDDDDMSETEAEQLRDARRATSRALQTLLAAAN